MTYTPVLEVDVYADARSFVTCTFQTNRTPTVDGIIPFADVQRRKEGANISINGTGGLTLGEGSWYYLEGAVQFELSTYPPTSATLSVTQWHNGTEYVGSYGQSRPQTLNPPDGASSVGDEKAITLIDATQGAVNVWFRCVSHNGILRYNSTSHSTYAYTGLSRAVVIELAPPS
jgi:hypothetical protein